MLTTDPPLALQALVQQITSGDQAPSSRRRLRAVLDLKDPAVIKSTLTATSNNLPGGSAVNSLSEAQLTTAATGISNVNNLATSATTVDVRTPPPPPPPPLLPPVAT